MEKCAKSKVEKQELVRGGGRGGVKAGVCRVVGGGGIMDGKCGSRSLNLSPSSHTYHLLLIALLQPSRPLQSPIKVMVTSMSLSSYSREHDVSS